MIGAAWTVFTLHRDAFDDYGPLPLTVAILIRALVP